MMPWLKRLRYRLSMTQRFGSLLLWLAISLGAAQAQQAVPALTSHVVDTADTLAVNQRDMLEARLSEFEKSNGSQVVVLLVPSTQPEDIASYANRVANTWKIGRKTIGDGLLLIVAVQDRKLRIEVAKTLEGAIPDLAAKRVIDEAITPHFKQGDYAGGIDAGITRIMGLIRGEALPKPGQGADQAAGGFDWMELGIFLFVAVPVIGAVARSMLGNRLGAVATGGAAGGIAMLLTASVLIAVLAGLAAMIFTLVQNSPGLRNSGLHRGGRDAGWGHGDGFGGNGGFGGGGFGSGGGGDFGGGGASGDW